MKGADVRCTVSEERQRHGIGLQVLRRPGGSIGNRQAGTDNGKRAKYAMGDVGEVHGAAFAMAEAPGTAHDFCHRAIHWRPHGQNDSVTAIGARHRVARSQDAATPNRYSFLPLT